MRKKALRQQIEGWRQRYDWALEDSHAAKEDAHEAREELTQYEASVEVATGLYRDLFDRMQGKLDAAEAQRDSVKEDLAERDRVAAEEAQLITEYLNDSNTDQIRWRVGRRFGSWWASANDGLPAAGPFTSHSDAINYAKGRPA